MYSESLSLSQDDSVPMSHTNSSDSCVQVTSSVIPWCELYDTKDYYDGDKAVGRVFKRSDVQKLFRNSGFFEEEEIGRWNEDVIVPFGTWAANFVAVTAARRGLRTNAMYSAGGTLVPVPQGLTSEELLVRNSTNGIRITRDGSLYDLNVCTMS